MPRQAADRSAAPIRVTVRPKVSSLPALATSFDAPGLHAERLAALQPERAEKADDAEHGQGLHEHRGEEFFAALAEELAQAHGQGHDEHQQGDDQEGVIDHRGQAAQQARRRVIGAAHQSVAGSGCSCR
jgi:hypothetical protein